MEEWQQVITRNVIIEGTIRESMSRYGKNLLFYYTEGDRYLGQWRQGVQQGVGTLFRYNASTQFKPHGIWADFYIQDLKNINFSRTGVYVGNWRDGLQDGNGTAMYNNGNKYTGQFK